MGQLQSEATGTHHAVTEGAEAAEIGTGTGRPIVGQGYDCSLAGFIPFVLDSLLEEGWKGGWAKSWKGQEEMVE